MALAELSDFFRADRAAVPILIRTPGRILIADESSVKPLNVDDVLDVAGGSYLASDGWEDLGFTKGGLRLSRQISEDGNSIDAGGRIVPMHSISSVEIETAMADMSLKTMAKVWENHLVVSGATARLGGGVLPESPLRRMVIAHPVYNTNAIMCAVRAYVFPLVELLPGEQQLNFARSGGAQTLPVKFRSVPDPTEYDIKRRFFYVMERKIGA